MGSCLWLVGGYIMVYNSVTDKVLVKCWISGDEKAFEELFVRYFSKLYKHCLKFISNRSDSEELVMDVLFKIWQKKRSINPELSLAPYLFKIATNKVIDHLRRQKIKTLPLEEYHISSYSYFADGYLLQKEMNLLYSQYIALLSPRERQVFTLSRIDGKSYKEIACMLNLSKNTVENHMAASLKQMRIYTSKEAV